ECVEWAGADVAVNDTDAPNGQREVVGTCGGTDHRSSVGYLMHDIGHEVVVAFQSPPLYHRANDKGMSWFASAMAGAGIPALRQAIGRSTHAGDRAFH